MSDLIDQAQFVEERDRQIALGQRHVTVPAVGSCYSCGERVEGQHKFCDADCRTDFEKREAARKRGGRVDD